MDGEAGRERIDRWMGLRYKVLGFRGMGYIYAALQLGLWLFFMVF